MKFRKNLFLSALFLSLVGGAAYAAESSIGLVNFMSCIMDSKYGKQEQQQMEKIAQNLNSLIEETEKELKSLSEKFEDKDYMDGLSPEAENEMKMKNQTLNEDLMKYHNQRYQAMQQAENFFIHRLTTAVSTASETVAANKKFDLILRKDLAFYADPKMDVTKLVIEQMDKNYDEDQKKQKEPKSDTKEEMKKSKEPQNDSKVDVKKPKESKEVNKK